MSELLPVGAAALSLLLTLAYAYLRKFKRMESDLESARRVTAVAGTRVLVDVPVEELLKNLLSELTRIYDGAGGVLQFRARNFGEYSITDGMESRASSPEERNDSSAAPEAAKDRSESDPQKRNLIGLVIEDNDFSCRIEFQTDATPSQSENWTIQEILREKISYAMLGKLIGVARSVVTTIGLPYAVLHRNGSVVRENNSFMSSFRGENSGELVGMIDELTRSGKQRKTFSNRRLGRNIELVQLDRDLFVALVYSDGERAGSAQSRIAPALLEALDDLNVGTVVLHASDAGQDPELKISSINRAFRRIFGLDGSSAQTEETSEILNSALGVNPGGEQGAAGEFSYMRHDGLRIRTKLTIIRNSDESKIVIFEPIENTRFLVSAQQQMLDAALELFVRGDLRLYLRTIKELTKADGVAYLKRDSDSNKLEVIEKAGFVINLPQPFFNDLAEREFVSSQGYYIVPVKDGRRAIGALVALKPHHDAVEVMLIGAKTLQSYDVLTREEAELRSKAVNSLDAAKRADDANRSKSEFLADMSHEIRTPLNSIIGFADIIHSDMNELDDGLLRDFSSNIVTAGKHLLSLINDILDLSKVETGKMRLELQEFAAGDAIESVRRILHPLLDAKRVRLDVSIENGVDIFTGDAVKFKQILYNLLNNAINYSHEGSSVRLEVVRLAEGIEVRVIDKGVGIRKEDIDKLFKPFVQLGEAHDGTGLGLVLTRKLVELHGGSMWIDSVFGAGTTVVVYLPHSNPRQSEAKTVVPSSDTAEEIFFITEDKQLFSLFTAIVEGVGYKITMVSPQRVRESKMPANEGSVLVIDAAPENLTPHVISACRIAGKLVLMTEPEDVESVSEMLRDYQSKLSFVDRRNFTKRELIAELSTAGRLRED